MNNINLESLKLDMDFPFLTISNSSTDSVNRKKITVTARVVDIYGNPLRNISIFVSDSASNNFERVKIYGPDQNQEIHPTLQGGIEGFSIKTDEHGNVLFFIHPNKALPVVLNLYSNIIGSTKKMPAKHTIFIVNNSLDNMETKFDMPEIINFFGEYLESDGPSEFDVEIPPYGSMFRDYILFFVNGEYTKYFTRVDHKDNTSTFTKLPYDIFKKNVYSNFFYVIVRDSGDALEAKSVSLPLTYQGGVIYKPDPKVERNYATCIVYTSLGVDGGAILPNGSEINYTAIRQYPNAPKAGLYIEILGTKDPGKEKDKVPLNIPVTVNMYLNSTNKSYIKSYHGKIKEQPLETNNKVAAVIHVPLDDIINVKSYQDGGLGNIYFDYKFYDGNDQYGEIWSASIETDIDDD
ncbi:hypothetical protein ABLB69_08895 [Xenorhabdus khoisanae]|uniref:Uncharacterized protein n=1 Tax=Xenorhabdus khoisanae TaxID=880157 RepID=A0A0J5IN15_9GAMM|nr:hypothetical protein [Xenorhabdus khoisanae]KMJ44590.1 hypothetical protein AB204_13720 [Xenorhabdus khoisanae]